jgi:thiol:disulfide interchange protein DsbD
MFMRIPFSPAFFSLLAGLALLSPCMAAHGQDTPAQVTATASDSTATLTAVKDGVTAGALPLLLTITPPPGWHTYWQNPGDAGAPLELAWELPQGFAADPLRWPVPERINTPPLVSFGYSGPVTFPITLKTPDGLSTPETRLSVAARYLVCAETCIPQTVTLTLMLPNVAAGQLLAPEAWASATTALPQEMSSLLPASTVRKGETVQVTFTRATLPPGDWQAAFFFPLPTGALIHSAPQNPRITADALTLTLIPQEGFSGEMPGLLRLTAGDGATVGLYITTTLPAAPARADAAPTPEIPTAATPRPAALAPLTALLLAFLGGLILNIMPCVFPVLSLKVLALSRHGQKEHGETLRESLAYAAGVISSFIALAGALILLKGAAGQLGWGFQLQEPWFVGALAQLLFAVGLNLSGVYEIPQLWHGNQPHRHGLVQSFLTGVLAVLLATPCTAPFMAPAIGFGLAQPPLVTLAIFIALGFGFALPFVIAGVFPRLLRFLPRPGGWMLTFRRVLAFPMYASAVWLVWVLAQQSTPNGVGLLLLGGLVLSGTLTFAPRLRPVPKMIAVTLTVICVGMLLRSVPATPPREATVSTETFSEELLASLRQAGKPVLVNVTAAWCITCKLNERLVLRRPDVQALLKAHGVTMLTADWTQGDPAITAYLQSFDRAGVPLYVYYASSQKVFVLPQILSVTTVTESINKG